MSSLQKIILFGAGDFARNLSALIEAEARLDIVGYCVDEPGDSVTFRGKPVVSLSDLEDRFPPRDHGFIVAVGYSKMNRIRRAKLDQIKAMGYRPESFISPHLKPQPELQLGEHVLILDSNFLHPYVSIGDNVVIWSGNVIGHDAVVGSDTFISSGAVVGGFSEVGRGCFLGPSCVISSEIKIGDEVFVGPGAVVTENQDDKAVLTAPKAQLRRLKSDRLPRF